MRYAFALLLALAVPLLAVGQEAAEEDPMAWIGRVYSAGQKLSYRGVIVYQSDGRSETSRIVHVFAGDHELEKLESLDGSPRQVIRTRDQVKCYLPRQRTLIVDQTGNSRGFPSRLVASQASLSSHYRIRLGPLDRVAGLQTRQILLEPLDELRYGLTLWADIDSGLLLKARMSNDKGEVVEQFSFTEVDIGGAVPGDEFTSPFEGEEGWKVINARGSEVSGEGLGWRLASEVPGFKMTSAVRRRLGDAHGEVVHLVFSDGLASMSVFIEPMPAVGEKSLGATSSGPVNIFTRRLEGYLVTVLGETPARAVEVLANSVEVAGR
ncbi:MAG: MucB/RseB C-terminal domain-containing protein [Rhodocyclaceae bacterium]|nr:MucB/RseB C-terminal domain-containing protein [Rhodocyclaceae bacterium]